MLEVANRAAAGKAGKCTCRDPYVCSHNKIASYNTRKPAKVVIEYRRNAKRLKRAGRPEEAQIWEEKAQVIDDEDQERWTQRVAMSIISSPWGANEAIVDKMTEDHKKELATLRTKHEFMRHQHESNHNMRRRNFRNTMLAEERKVRMQCRKLALMRQYQLNMNKDPDDPDGRMAEIYMSESTGLRCAFARCPAWKGLVSLTSRRPNPPVHGPQVRLHPLSGLEMPCIPHI